MGYVNSFERPKTVQEAVLEKLRQQMLDGRFPPGVAIRPDTVGTEMGVSAVPVREALRILEGEGHVSYRPHRGYVVTDLDIQDLADIYLIRGLLESEAVRRAVPKLDSDTIDELQSLVDEMGTAKDVVELSAINRRYHFILFDKAEMPQLTRMLRILWDSSDRYRALYLMSSDNRQLVNEQHQRIMNAIAERDVEQVLREKDLHRDHAITSLTSAIQQSQEGAA